MEPKHKNSKKILTEIHRFMSLKNAAKHLNSSVAQREENYNKFKSWDTDLNKAYSHFTSYSSAFVHSVSHLFTVQNLPTRARDNRNIKKIACIRMLMHLDDIACRFQQRYLNKHFYPNLSFLRHLISKFLPINILLNSC